LVAHGCLRVDASTSEVEPNALGSDEREQPIVVLVGCRL
jgi:hypothetical protein